MTNSDGKFNHFGGELLIYLCMGKNKSICSKLFYMDIFPYILQNNKLSTEFGIPLYQNLNGIQMANKYSVFASWTIMF